MISFTLPSRARADLNTSSSYAPPCPLSLPHPFGSPLPLCPSEGTTYVQSLVVPTYVQWWVAFHHCTHVALSCHSSDTCVCFLQCAYNGGCPPGSEKRTGADWRLVRCFPPLYARVFLATFQFLLSSVLSIFFTFRIQFAHLLAAPSSWVPFPPLWQLVKDTWSILHPSWAAPWRPCRPS